MTHVLTASSTKTCKQCPYKYYLRYVVGLRRDREATPLRFGGNWHRGLELLGQGCVAADMQGQLATEYRDRPEYISPEAWEVEYYTVASALAAYAWYYQNDGLEVVATESEFCLPITNPESGRPSTKWRRAGKIDRRIRMGEHEMIEEHKTTSEDIAPGSDYWRNLRIDSQISMYLSAAREIGHPTSGILYDVFRKPQIRPKKLSLKDAVGFLTTNLYCGQTFDVTIQRDEAKKIVGVQVNACKATLEPLKAGPTLRETPAMFGARVLQSITELPDQYFARQEIARTEADMEAAAFELWAIMQQINSMSRTGHWYKNETQCVRMGRCEFCDICFDGVDVTNDVPDGFIRVENPHVELSTLKETNHATNCNAHDSAA